MVEETCETLAVVIRLVSISAINACLQKWRDPSLWIALTVFSALSIVLFKSQNPPMLGDYSEWTYHGAILRDTLQGHPDTAYLLKNYPVPNSLTTVGLGMLMLLVPWAVACKLWLLLGTLLGLMFLSIFQGESGKPQTWKFLVGIPAILLGIPFWFGFNNFLLGTFFAFALCALLIRAPERRWLCSGLLLLTFFSHMIPFAFALSALCLQAYQRGRYRTLFAAIPSCVFCIWYFVGRAAAGNIDAQAGMVSSVRYFSPLFAAFKINSYLKCWGFVNPAYGEQDSLLLFWGSKVYVGLFLLNCFVALAILLLCVRKFSREWKDRGSKRFLWCTVLLFFVASLIMPGAAAGISDPGGRMMQVSVWCGLCLVDTDRRWLKLALASCAVCLLVADFGLFVQVAMKPPHMGVAGGGMPERLKQFGHVFYADRSDDLDAIQQHRMNKDIFPTALFRKR